MLYWYIMKLSIKKSSWKVWKNSVEPNLWNKNSAFLDLSVRRMFLFLSWMPKVHIYSCANLQGALPNSFRKYVVFIVVNLRAANVLTHSARSMNWHARTCFRRRISRKTRNSFAVSNTLNIFTSCKYKKLWIWTYKSPDIGVKNCSPAGPIARFHKSLNVEHCFFLP
jgi:hypothetical protein